MATRACLFLLVSLLGTLGPSEWPRELIVWNVGQGQWVTISDESACWHLDMGGETAPWREIQRHCRSRPNSVSLSHWDMDHISFVRSARIRLPSLCLLNRPAGSSSLRKMQMVDAIPRCQRPSPFAQWVNPTGSTANAKSWVVVFRQVLAPGDSTRTEESRWLSRLPLLEVSILVLGHHGSRTSTSKALLENLQNLKMAIASARFRRYGHPHREVVSELNKIRVPLLRTEEWGTIHVML